MDDHQELPDSQTHAPINSRTGLARPSTFSLILDFTGKAELQTASVNVSLAALVCELNNESAAIADSVSEEIKGYLKLQLPAADVSVKIDFSLGSIQWAGVAFIADVFAGINDNTAFAEHVRKATQFILNKTIRRRIEQQASRQNATVKSVATLVATARAQILSQGRRHFLWWCAGAVPETLRLYPTEKAKYEGIGGAVLTTGVLAFLSGFYAIYTTLATGPYSVLTSIGFGVLWAAAIFNLDRYIVSSLHKPTDAGTRWRQRLAQTWLPALPRLALAILIGITLSKPLELRLFNNAIAGQAEINRDQAVMTKRASLTESSRLGEISAELNKLNEEIASKQNRATFLEDEFHKETDGTGGSLRYGYSAVARLKEAAALQARQQVTEVQERAQQLQAEKDRITAQNDQQVDAFRQSLTDDFLTRMRALADLSANSLAVWWVSTFVMFLLIGIEITPVLVKLLSPIGPYDVKLDALNSVGTNEALLKRDAAMRIARHHYAHVERAEIQADDTLLDIRTTLARRELEHKADQWKTAKAAGASVTVEQFVNEVRTEVLTQRSLG
jgi:hypothetical protein